MNICSLCRDKKTIISRDINTNHIAYSGNGDNTLANSITTINISEINNNSFLKGIIWGGKQTNLKDNTIKWTINYGAVQSSINLYDVAKDNRNLINVSEIYHINETVDCIILN